MLNSRHIVVEDYPDGTTKALYNGADVLAAGKAFDEAISRAEAQAVMVFHFPLPSRIRYPLQEKAAAEERGRQSELQAKAAADAKRNEAGRKRDLAKQLSAEAKKLEAEAKAHEQELAIADKAEESQTTKDTKGTKANE